MRPRTSALSIMLLALTCLWPAIARAESVRVIVEKSTIWRNRTGTAGVVAIVPAGTKLEVKGREGRWLIIEDPIDPRRVAYILASQTEPVDGQGQPTPPPVVLAPRTASPVNPTPRSAARPTTPRTQGRRTTRAFVLANGGYTADATWLATTQSAFADLYQEAGAISATYGRPAQAQLHLAMGAGRGALALGGAVMVSRTSKPADVSVSVPSPFLFNTPRTASTTTDGLKSTDVEFQIPIFWTANVGRQLSVVAFGGPSIFWTRRSLVTDASLNDAYPFTTVRIAHASTQQRSGHAVGGHGGLEAFYGRRLAIGGGVSFSRGTVSLSTGDLTGSVRVGGLRGLVGIRVPF